MDRLKTIIIDDEPIACRRLAGLLNDYGDRFQVIAEAGNGIDGAEKINELKPDLVFLDIQMPGKTGFEMLEELEYLPKIVFCTAFEAFALQAFNTMALDYLVKPVEKERLKLTLEKLDRSIDNSSQLQVDELLRLVKENSEKKYCQSIPHKIGDRVLLVKTEKITYFKASENYVDFFTNDGGEYLTEMSLRKLSERLPDSFRQVHRSVIVNVNYIKECRKYFRGKYVLILDDANKTKLETGRSFSDPVKSLISID
ncbi:MAG: LytTR family transcriptional regulator DNA-binding domain-containing protein [Bacteroidales bacterium]|nr:LytTR family transcriptional regulator DNA-binding domain-containing protein [Bacteroidales bacterium]